MGIDSEYWMQFSVEITKGSTLSGLQVGVVLVSAQGNLLCSAFAGEENNALWLSVLLKKICKLKISSVESLYITVNTLSDHSFDLNVVFEYIHVNNLYVGLPDPTLSCYCDTDPVLTLNNVFRYHDRFQREILEQNSMFYGNCKQNIKYSPYYCGHRISRLVKEILDKRCFCVSYEEINANKQQPALAALICDKYGIVYEEALDIVHNALSDAFNSKYSIYNYSEDVRSLDLNWKKNFFLVCARTFAGSFLKKNILNVGVGSGYEAIALFSNCERVTFVDISHGGLEKIKQQIPTSKTFVSSADDLSPIPDQSQDLYVSLRTYNSSFFDIKKSLIEAYRVLKSNSTIIISIANGFLCSERRCIIPGLILPGTEFVDIYRGMDTTQLIQAEFINVGFERIRIFPTNTEIYLSAFKE